MFPEGNTDIMSIYWIYGHFNPFFTFHKKGKIINISGF